MQLNNNMFQTDVCVPFPVRVDANIQQFAPLSAGLSWFEPVILHLFVGCFARADQGYLKLDAVKQLA